MFSKEHLSRIIWGVILYIPFIGKKLALNPPLSRYPYHFSPEQLFLFTEAINELETIDGCLLEVGCLRGWTTQFLCEHLKYKGYHRDYICIDTFKGFLKKDLEYEYNQRNKSPAALSHVFKFNKKSWFDLSAKESKNYNVKSIQCDAGAFDYQRLAPIAFCLLDVDFYLPVKQALPKIYEALIPGGIIFVDDCSTQDDRWDGAKEAYEEFCKEKGLPITILEEKIGLIKKEE